MTVRESQESEAERAAGLFKAHLNSSGFPFQHAVLRRAEELSKKGSPWVFQASEFPVHVQENQTRVDFILAQLIPSVGYRRLMVGECKRVNPALGRWLFSRAPYVQRDFEPDQILVEKMQRQHFGGGQSDNLFTGYHRLHQSKDIYHVALEARLDAKGDSNGPQRGGIEDASIQVMRGLNGLIEVLARAPLVLPENRDITLIPAIFTTAELWVTETDLATADLATGKVEVLPGDVRPMPWLWFQYHPSPGLRHEVERYFDPTGRPHWQEGLAPLLEREFARAIAVVSPAGIDAFLMSSLWGR